MTYCIGLALKAGLVMLADTRTNAGVDNISTFAKLYLIERPGERVIALMTAGNLAITQAVMNHLLEGIEDGGKLTTLHDVGGMFKAAQLVGTAIRTVHASDGEALKAQGIAYDVSIIVGGQIKGRRMRLFRVYAAGNFVEATDETPYLQIGEHKYGKPILDRAVDHATSLEDGVKLALVSMDSTLRSNLTVGLPADLLVYRRDALEVAYSRRITNEDPYFNAIRGQWGEALRDAYRGLPTPGWEGERDVAPIQPDYPDPP